MSTWLHILIFSGSLAFLAKGADWFVEYTARIAKRLGVSDLIIGLTVTSIGTSLPELASSLSATFQGHPGIVIGNVLGSNIANLLLITGICGVIRPMQVSEISVVYTIPIMLFFSIALLYIVRSDWRVTRRQGILAVTAYGLFIALAFWQGWS